MAVDGRQLAATVLVAVVMKIAACRPADERRLTVARQPGRHHALVGGIVTHDPSPWPPSSAGLSVSLG
jgi:hypothetical protein